VGPLYVTKKGGVLTIIGTPVAAKATARQARWGKPALMSEQKEFRIFTAFQPQACSVVLGVVLNKYGSEPPGFDHGYGRHAVEHI
jgi:hypothetical protein